jgi:hypothetical protein
MSFTEEGVYINLFRPVVKPKTSETIGIFTRLSPKETEMAKLKLSFAGGNLHPAIVGENKKKWTVNYLKGKDRKEWYTNIPTYGAILYKGIYEGIDIRFYGKNSKLEYDIIVNPGAELDRVRLSVDGIEKMKMSNNGDLIMYIGKASMTLHKPFVYQEIAGERVKREGSFKLIDQKTYAFIVKEYSKNYPLVIDPILSFSTYLGGSDWDHAEALAVDSNGCVYVAHATGSSDFPTTQSPFPSLGAADVFITKYSGDGSLIFSVLFGGSSQDWVQTNGLWVDEQGYIYVGGVTRSSDFPVTENAFQSSLGGREDGFIVKLAADGANMLYSTYLGKSWNDGIFALIVDDNNSIYVSGRTNSTDFPTTNNAFQTDYQGGLSDAFITKLSADGSGLVFSTYLGGSKGEKLHAISLDDFDNVYVGGYTVSSNFPVTSNAYQANN